MTVGTASVNWGFDPLYVWVKTPSFERMLDEMAQAGYDGTEISYNFPNDPQRIARELSARNLRAAATFHAVNVRSRENHESALRSTMKVADRLQQLEADVLILSDEASEQRLAVAGRVGPEHQLAPEQWQALADGLNRIGTALANRGMRAVFHPHVGTHVETRDEIDTLCRLTDPAAIGLCPDTGHLAYAGVSAESLFSDYADRIAYVHLKDIDAGKLRKARSDGIGFVDAVRLGMFVELGQGMVPIASIIDSLKHAKYTGWLIVEQDAPADPLRAANANRRYLREQFAL